MTLEERVRRLTLKQIYQRQEEPSALPTHLLWQAPLAAAAPNDPVGVLSARMELAGRLWLRNLDLRFSRRLIISHCEEPLSYVFQRANLPDETNLVAGPSRVSLLRHGPTMFHLPIRFFESLETYDRTLFASF